MSTSTEQEQEQEKIQKEILIEMFQTFSCLRKFFPEEFRLTKCQLKQEQTKNPGENICKVASAIRQGFYQDDDTRFIDNLRAAYSGQPNSRQPNSRQPNTLILNSKEDIRKAFVFSLRFLGKSKEEVHNLIFSLLKPENPKILHKSFSTRPREQTLPTSYGTKPTIGGDNFELIKYYYICLNHFYPDPDPEPKP